MNNDTLSLVKVVTDYTFALDTLDDYDHQRLVLRKSNAFLLLPYFFKTFWIL